MRWHVTGVNANTGNPQATTIEADDEKAALVAAKTKGIMATSATMIRATPLPEGPSPVLQYAVPDTSPPPPVEVRRPRVDVPNYMGLTVMAALCLVAGIGSVLSGLSGLANVAAEHDTGGGLTIDAGMVLCFVAFAGFALRDIARNSWRK